MPIVSGGGSGIQTGSQLDYAEITSNVTISATTAGAANAIVTGNSVAYDGATAVVIEFFCPAVDTTAANGGGVLLELFEDGSGIGELAIVRDVAAAILKTPVLVRRRMTPSNASHTYSIRGWRTTGDGTIECGAGGAAGTLLPAYIRITRA